jgi:Sugar-transfer associated ATP-grasp
LLGDKVALAERLSAQGIPMVDTATVSRGDWQDLEAALLRHPKLFCKLRSGNQGESAFAVWRAESGLQGLAHDGMNLLDEDAVQLAWQVLTRKGEVLLQPLLINHPLLAPASPSNVAITLRLVTRQTSEGAYAWWVELLVPEEARLGATRGYWSFPVTVSNGFIQPIPRESLLTDLWERDSQAILMRLSGAEHLPFWQELCTYSIQAHSTLPKVWAIAWDWVITPDGPVLLEGNSGWGVESAQYQGLDFLDVHLHKF